MVLLLVLLLLVTFLVLVFFNRRGCNKADIIRALLRQSARWATASRQDQSPLIAVLHANYGAGYLWALQDIATAQEIESVGIIDDLTEFRDEILRTQDWATRKAIEVCPQYAPELGGVLGKIGGEGV